MKVNVCIDAVSSNGMLCIFNEKREILCRKNISMVWQESKLLLITIHEFLKENNLKCEDIVKMIVVNGPGSFTGIRTVTLIVNAIWYIYKNILFTPLSFFELYDTYPIVKASSKRDVFIKKTKSSPIEIMQNEEVLQYLKENDIQTIHGNVNTSIFNDFTVAEEINYDIIIKNIEYQDEQRVQALYIKKPNIS